MKVKVTQLCPTLQPHGLYNPWNSPGQNTVVGSLSLLQGIFPTQESNQGLLHCRRILYQLSYQDVSLNFGPWKEFCLISSKSTKPCKCPLLVKGGPGSLDMGKYRAANSTELDMSLPTTGVLS